LEFCAFVPVASAPFFLELLACAGGFPVSFFDLQGRVRFPTGGDSPRAERQMQCNSATDSTVWMEEDETNAKTRLP